MSSPDRQRHPEGEGPVPSSSGMACPEGTTSVKRGPGFLGVLLWVFRPPLDRCGCASARPYRRARTRRSGLACAANKQIWRVPPKPLTPGTHRLTLPQLHLCTFAGPNSGSPPPLHPIGQDSYGSPLPRSRAWAISSPTPTSAPPPRCPAPAPLPARPGQASTAPPFASRGYASIPPGGGPGGMLVVVCGGYGVRCLAAARTRGSREAGSVWMWCIRSLRMRGSQKRRMWLAISSAASFVFRWWNWTAISFARRTWGLGAWWWVVIVGV